VKTLVNQLLVEIETLCGEVTDEKLLKLIQGFAAIKSMVALVNEMPQQEIVVEELKAVIPSSKEVKKTSIIRSPQFGYRRG